MKFRPCIYLHSGQVKQIVGYTLSTQDTNDNLITNFSSFYSASYFAKLYQRDNLKGGHIILLNQGNQDAAKSALVSYPNGLQIGGGIDDTNWKEWIDSGASHVIITSYLFKHGTINMNRLISLSRAIGKKNLVIDLSCRKKEGDKQENYYVVTNKWQTYTDIIVNKETLEILAEYCNEFLIHGVENEGKQCGILEDLVILLGKYSPIPVTYAGGVNCLDNVDQIEKLGRGKVDVTIGSALDCFGGNIKYEDVVDWHKKRNI